MKFHAPTKQWVIRQTDIEGATTAMLYAIANIRKMAKKPLTPYKNNGTLERHDHAMKCVIDAAEAIGIDLGTKWGHELDVSDYEN